MRRKTTLATLTVGAAMALGLWACGPTALTDAGILLQDAGRAIEDAGTSDAAAQTTSGCAQWEFTRTDYDLNREPYAQTVEAGWEPFATYQGMNAGDVVFVWLRRCRP